jgi:hypothetical protein
MQADEVERSRSDAIHFDGEGARLMRFALVTGGFAILFSIGFTLSSGPMANPLPRSNRGPVATPLS